MGPYAYQPKREAMSRRLLMQPLGTPIRVPKRSEMDYLIQALLASHALTSADRGNDKVIDLMAGCAKGNNLRIGLAKASTSIIMIGARAAS